MATVILVALCVGITLGLIAYALEAQNVARLREMRRQADLKLRQQYSDAE